MQRAAAVVRLESWFETMRCAMPPGYGGPVAHWWQNCLQFTGAGLDWRYEGILYGYLSLYAATQDRRWLDKAKRAGDDLRAGQLASGSYADSRFELNPYAGGTPGEAAASAGLLALARTLRAEQDPAWESYYQTAARNLRAYFIGRLWDEAGQHFRDAPDVPSFVPNKAATLCEALFLLAELSGDDAYIVRYALPTLDLIVSEQVKSGVGVGAVPQNRLRGALVGRFMPYYVARCVPALVLAHQHTGRGAYLAAAKAALDFVFRQRDDDGGFVQCVYDNGRYNRYPRWVAAVGDILTAADLLIPYGFNVDLTPTIHWMLTGQNANGGMGTARGFAAQTGQRVRGGLPEFRDILPVCGWADKAFRWLAALPAGTTLPESSSAEAVEIPCTLRGKTMLYIEDSSKMELKHGARTLYRWHKGDAWASRCAPEVMWK